MLCLDRKIVCIAGATGYLGRHLVAEYHARGWKVLALVRDASKARDLPADHLVEAEATDPETLVGKLDGVDLVVSALGITRQRDGLGYWDVDFQANANLLAEAERARVGHFAYVHVLGAQQMRNVALVQAKQAFADRLIASNLRSTLVCPSGFFSDMADFYAMAERGRVWLFGKGARRLNPIHGADLAFALADAVEAEAEHLDVGGPDVFTQKDLAALALQVAGQERRITCLPDVFRRMVIVLLPWITPRHIWGPAQFFLTAMGIEAVGQPHGTRHLSEHFEMLKAQAPKRSMMSKAAIHQPK